MALGARHVTSRYAAAGICGILVTTIYLKFQMKWISGFLRASKTNRWQKYKHDNHNTIIIDIHAQLLLPSPDALVDEAVWTAAGDAQETRPRGRSQVSPLKPAVKTAMWTSYQRLWGGLDIPRERRPVAGRKLRT